LNTTHAVAAAPPKRFLADRAVCLVAFTGGDAGIDQVYVIGSYGYELVRLTCATDDFHATSSPDGTRLLFVWEDHPGVSDTSDGGGTI
jgi:hypothetical protein